MATEVLIAVGHSWESRLATLVDGAPGLSVSRRCVDLADLLSAVAAGHGDVAVVSTDLRGLDREAVARTLATGVRVVGASPDGDEADERRLRQLGVPATIHLGLDPAELAEVLETTGPAPLADPLPRVDGLAGLPGDDEAGDGGPVDPFVPAHADPGRSSGADLPTPDEPTRGRIVAVWGPTGAPGRTTVAIGIASEAALLGTPVVLLDLDTYGASVAQALSMLDEAPGMAAAARASELGTLDVTTLARLAPEVSPGLRVVSGIIAASRWPELRGAAVEHILDLARSLAPLVVLDLGFCAEDDEELSYDTDAPRRNITTLVGLERADELLVVGAADPIGLQRMVRAVQSLAAVPSPPPRAIVNRVRSSAVGSDPERRIAESLQRFAGIEEVAFVPDDPGAADAALLAGRTLAESAPQSPARLTLRALAAGLTGASLPRSERSARRRRPVGSSRSVPR